MTTPNPSLASLLAETLGRHRNPFIPSGLAGGGLPGAALGILGPLLEPDMRRRALAFALAVYLLPKEGSDGHERVYTANYLERGYDPEPEGEQLCACNTTEQATHERGTEGFCRIESVQ